VHITNRTPYGSQYGHSDYKHGMVCPCGSEKNFGDCCAPIHEGRQTAATAEILMRSRYTAYVLKNESYLLQTWHESSRPAQLNLEQDHIQWLGLKIIKCEKGGIDNDAGEVEFIASYIAGGKTQRIHERSRFIKQNMHWYYVDGEMKQVD
jgi:SEC-C motif-containing protein